MPAGWGIIANSSPRFIILQDITNYQIARWRIDQLAFLILNNFDPFCIFMAHSRKP